jgi:hypothetical protein
MTQRSLARWEPPPGLGVVELGQMMAASGFFQDTKDAAQAAVKIIAGQELGFGPVASMTGIHIVQGRITLSANLIAAAIRRSGRYGYRILELSDEVCRLEFLEEGTSVGVTDFTWKDAERAQLAGKPIWKQYPRNMLFARAMSNGARFYCPDVFGGPVYTPEELGASVRVTDGGEVEVVDVAPPAVAAPPPGRSAAIKEALSAAIEEADEEVDEDLAERRREAAAMNPPNERARTEHPRGVPGDDVDALSGWPLVEACERLRRVLNARGLPHTALPPEGKRTNPGLRQWWHAGAALLLAADQAAPVAG